MVEHQAHTDEEWAEEDDNTSVKREQLRRERLIIYIADAEKLLAVIEEEMTGKFPTLSAVELRPKLVRAMSLAREYIDDAHGIADIDAAALREEFSVLESDIRKLTKQWRSESKDSILEGLFDDRPAVSGTMVVPENWESKPQ